jgi:hypothetical protein
VVLSENLLPLFPHFVLKFSGAVTTKKKGELRKEIGGGNMRLASLLGDPKKIPHTLDYIEETGRLEL